MILPQNVKELCEIILQIQKYLNYYFFINLKNIWCNFIMIAILILYYLLSTSGYMWRSNIIRSCPACPCPIRAQFARAVLAHAQFAHARDVWTQSDCAQLVRAQSVFSPVFMPMPSPCLIHSCRARSCPVCPCCAPLPIPSPTRACAHAQCVPNPCPVPAHAQDWLLD
jgi:hypothetical protein